MIYLDYAASCPIYPAVLDEMDAISREIYANPSSLYRIGYQARKILQNSRSVIASSIGAQTDEIVFTSGGTESNNLALFGVLRASGSKKHFIVGSIEHHSVLHAARALEREGYSLSILPCDANGVYSAEQLARMIRADTALISLQLANNETGVLQPIAEIGALTRAKRIPLHCDAVAAYAHIPINVNSLKIDLLSASAHKIGGPRGAGLLFVRNEIPIVPLFFGGLQERALRPGTENLSAIAGFAKAIACASIPASAAVRDRLASLLTVRFPDAVINGSNAPRVPHILNITLPGVTGERILPLLSEQEVYLSARAACAGGERNPSHVLLAMGISSAKTTQTLRFSTGFGSKLSDADETVHAIDFALRNQFSVEHTST